MTLQRSSLREQVRDLLLERIANGELKPGDRIVEARLVEELQASNIPVREAIRELVAKRVLDSAPHKGAWVRQPSVLEAIEAYKSFIQYVPPGNSKYKKYARQKIKKLTTSK